MNEKCKLVFWCPWLWFDEKIDSDPEDTSESDLEITSDEETTMEVIESNFVTIPLEVGDS